MNFYTHIIAGAGAAGLSLALKLVREYGPKIRILILDKSEKTSNDRTWCFWHKGVPPHVELVSKSWNSFQFADRRTGAFELPLDHWSYYMIRGIDFYTHAKTVLSKCEGVDFLQATVESIYESNDRAVVIADGQEFRSRYVFNSCYLTEDEKRHTLPGNFLWQDFHGWWIEAEKPIFSSGTATLMDFRTPQNGETRFFYVLPTSDRTALIEHTIFGKHRLQQAEHGAAIREYLSTILELSSYTIKERETGCIPMTDIPIAGKQGNRIVRLGALGGAVKPTTGFAFLRIQQQVKDIMDALREGNPPGQHISTSAGRFRFYDTLLLEILSQEGERGSGIFSALFRKNPVSRVLEFLDESTSLREEACLFATLPMYPFLKAVVTSRIRKKQPELTSQVSGSLLMPKKVPA